MRKGFDRGDEVHPLIKNIFEGKQDGSDVNIETSITQFQAEA